MVNVRSGPMQSPTYRKGTCLTDVHKLQRGLGMMLLYNIACMFLCKFNKSVKVRQIFKKGG